MMIMTQLPHNDNDMVAMIDLKQDIQLVKLI